MMPSEIKTSSEVHAVLAEILSEYEASYDPHDFDGRKAANKNFGIETAVFLLWLTAVLNHLNPEEVLWKFGEHLIDHPIRESYLNVIGDYGDKWEIDATNLLLVATKDDPRIFDVINDIFERESEKMKLESIKTKIDAHRAIINILEKHEEIEKNRRKWPKIDCDDIDISKTEEVENLLVNSPMFTQKVAKTLLYIGAVMNSLPIEDVLEGFHFKTITQGLSPLEAYIEILRLYPNFVLDPRITIIYTAESADVYEVIEEMFD